MKLSYKQLHFLRNLREDSRRKLTDISKETKIPISTLFDHLKILQQNYISKSTVLVDFSKLGYNTRAQIFMKVKQDHKEQLKKHLLLHETVNNIYRINNGWDFIIETVHNNNKELDKFIEHLEQDFAVEKTEIHYLIEDIKREGFLPKKSEPF